MTTTAAERTNAAPDALGGGALCYLGPRGATGGAGSLCRGSRSGADLLGAV